MAPAPVGKHGMIKTEVPSPPNLGCGISSNNRKDHSATVECIYLDSSSEDDDDEEEKNHRSLSAGTIYLDARDDEDERHQRQASNSREPTVSRSVKIKEESKAATMKEDSGSPLSLHADPLAAPRSAPSPSPLSDLFAPPHSDPFAPPHSDPFAPPHSDPFAPPHSDPFAPPHSDPSPTPRLSGRFPTTLTDSSPSSSSQPSFIASERVTRSSTNSHKKKKAGFEQPTNDRKSVPTRAKTNSNSNGIKRKSEDPQTWRHEVKRSKRKEYENNSWHQRPEVDEDLLEESDDEPIREGQDLKYAIDYIMAMDKKRCLVKWTGYPEPTVESVRNVGKGPAREFYEEAELAAEMILKSLKTECLCRGTDFTTEYPHAEMKVPVVPRLGSCVRDDKRVAYLVKLLDWRQQLNREARGRGLPALHVFDFTEDGCNRELPNFKYTTNVAPVTEEARELMEKTVEFERRASSKPEEGCKCAGDEGCCSSAKTDGCSCHGEGYKYMKRNSCLDLANHDKEKAPVDIWECGDDCECPPDCAQRVVQRGRKVILALVRDPRKGWTVRTCQKLLQGTFIGVYGGELKVMGGEGDITYQMDLDTNALAKGCDLVLDAKDAGCESRFMSHSCNANTFGLQVHFRRRGFAPLHVAIFASKRINPGSELTCDYHSDESIPIPYDCWCGHRTCRRPAKELLEKWRAEDEEEKEKEEERSEENKKKRKKGQHPTVEGKENRGGESPPSMRTAIKRRPLKRASL